MTWPPFPPDIWPAVELDWPVCGFAGAALVGEFCELSELWPESAELWAEATENASNMIAIMISNLFIGRSGVFPLRGKTPERPASISVNDFMKWRENEKSGQSPREQQNML
jgi:hypothetical protein